MVIESWIQVNDRRETCGENLCIAGCQEDEMGNPLYCFERIKTFKSGQKYCDVEEAFKMELGLGDYRSKSR